MTLSFQRSLAVLKQKPLRLFGIGFYLAWVSLVIARMPALTDYAGLPFDESTVRLSLSGTICFWLFVIMFFQKALDVFGSRKWLLAFAASGSSTGTILLVVSLLYVPSLAVLFAACIIIGCSTSMLLLSWGELFSNIRISRLMGHIVVSCPFSLAITIFALSLPYEAYLTLSALFPVLSGLILISCSNEPTRESSFATSWTGSLGKLFASCFVVGIALAVVRTTPEVASIMGEQAMLLYGIQLLVVCGVVVLVAMNGKDVGSSVVVLYRLSIPLLLLGYLFLAFAPSEAKVGFYALSSAGSLLFFRLMWLIYPLVVVRFKYTEVRLFGWGEIALHGGILVGELMRLWIVPSIPDDQLLVAACLVATFSVFLISYFIFRELDVVQIIERACIGDRSHALSAVPVRPLLSIAESYGMTPRETEVFSLLAKGRSLPYIEKQLVISNSTVKTHVKHIYEKMDVSNRQEFHDAVERAQSVD